MLVCNLKSLQRKIAPKVVTMEERSGITADEDEGGIEEPWRMVSSMRVGRSYLASAPMADRYIFVVGGCLSEGHSTGEVYDTETGAVYGFGNRLQYISQLSI